MIGVVFEVIGGERLGNNSFEIEGCFFDWICELNGLE